MTDSPFGEVKKAKPEIDFPGDTPPSELVVEDIEVGKGEEASAGRTISGRLRVRDTVIGETPARRATSLRVGGLPSGRPRQVEGLRSLGKGRCPLRAGVLDSAESYDDSQGRSSG